MRRAGSLMREIIGLGRGTARVAGRFSGYSCTARNTVKAFAGRDLRRNLAPNSRLDIIYPTADDCQSCGACCLNCRDGREDYVYLTPGDAKRLRRYSLPILTIDGERYLGTKPYDDDLVKGNYSDARICAAFYGRIGGECGCSVYK